jgi:hypothetical protein
MSAHECVVLAIDPGARSGFAVFERGALLASGSLLPSESRVEVAREAARLSEASGLPLVAVAEKWTAGGWRSAASMIGTGAAWGVWLGALGEIGQPNRRIVRVTTQAWRKAVLGMNARAGHDALKAASQLRARTVVGREVGHDEADAVCIGLWASYADEVGNVVPKRWKRGNAA